MRAQESFRRIENYKINEYKEMITKINSSIMYEYHRNNNFFAYTITKYEEIIKDFMNPKENSLLSTSKRSALERYSKLLFKVLDSLIQGKYNNSLIRLICQTYVPKNYIPGNFSLFSVYTSSLIRELLEIISNEVFILNNKNHFRTQFLERLDDDMCKYIEIDLPGITATKRENELFIRKLCEIAFLRHIKTFFSNYQSIDKHYRKIPNTLESYEHLTINSYFYEAINQAIFFCKVKTAIKTSFGYLLKNCGFKEKEYCSFDKKECFLLLHHDGITFNKISHCDLKNPDDINKAKSIHFGCLSTKSGILEKSQDLSYFENLIFDFEEKKEFEFFMGLLQYYSEAQKRKIMCLYEAKSFKVKVLRASTNIDFLLEYYKSKFDITESFLKELKDNEKKYQDKRIETLVELKEYFFIKREGCTKVFSKCLQLSCSHILAKELLEEFFDNDLERCPYCNIDVQIIGYLEIDLYTTKDPVLQKNINN